MFSQAHLILWLATAISAILPVYLLIKFARKSFRQQDGYRLFFACGILTWPGLLSIAYLAVLQAEGYILPNIHDFANATAAVTLAYGTITSALVLAASLLLSLILALSYGLWWLLAAPKP